jgi:hypothetical protein
VFLILAGLFRALILTPRTFAFRWLFAGGPGLALVHRISVGAVGRARGLACIALVVGRPGRLFPLFSTRLVGRLLCVLPIRSLLRRFLGLRLLLFSAGLRPGRLQLLRVGTGRLLRRLLVLRLLRLPLFLAGRVAGPLRVGILPGELILLLRIRRRLV